MKQIKANVSESRYRMFEVIDESPEVGDVVEKGQFRVIEINPVELDPEQPNDEYVKYDFFEILKKDILFGDEEDDSSDYSWDYICILREEYR